MEQLIELSSMRAKFEEICNHSQNNTKLIKSYENKILELTHELENLSSLNSAIH